MDKAIRIYSQFRDKEYNNPYTVKRLYAELLRATAKELPNTVHDTMLDIAKQFEELDKNPNASYTPDNDPYGGY